VTNQEFFAQTLSGEFERFRNVIAALPAARLDYRHDAKARSAGDLVGHLIGHFEDLTELLDAGVINHRIQVPFADLDEGVAAFERSYRELESKLKAASADVWAKPAEFRVGDKVLMTVPTQALMWMLFLDAVHHRGQLSTCIRPMGGKVPPIYGPSADTAMAH
jgi:uncharacterized damage-inducible protein DinB